MDDSFAVTSRAALPAFLEQFRSQEFRERLARRLGNPTGRVDEMLEANFRQISLGLDLLSTEDLRGKRILEVGAGQGFLSLFLRAQGFDASAVEPAMSGFEQYEIVNEEVRAAAAPLVLPFFAIGAEELNPAKQGRFDIIFSVYVLEHLPKLDQAFAAMRSVLTQDGVMLHLCANYAFPYEPHFGVPLLPGMPKVTEWLLPDRITRSELWRSINFITYGRVQHLCRDNDLVAEFTGGLLYQQLNRLASDPTFRARHRSSFVTWTYDLMRLTHLLPLTKHAPKRLVSPMQFKARAASHS